MCLTTPFATPAALLRRVTVSGRIVVEGGKRPVTNSLPAAVTASCGRTTWKKE
ncbi:hypothetical protein HMPREF9154_3168 [Arachnia propionica F0230a]|nr:hypothetical protein HMPREF9154_3168 [Arachnia propionica F0230a]